jgi:hypothetical protein
MAILQCGQGLKHFKAKLNSWIATQNYSRVVNACHIETCHKERNGVPMQSKACAFELEVSII